MPVFQSCSCFSAEGCPRLRPQAAFLLLLAQRSSSDSGRVRENSAGVTIFNQSDERLQRRCSEEFLSSGNGFLYHGQYGLRGCTRRSKCARADFDSCLRISLLLGVPGNAHWFFHADDLQ